MRAREKHTQIKTHTQTERERQTETEAETETETETDGQTDEQEQENRKQSCMSCQQHHDIKNTYFPRSSRTGKEFENIPSQSLPYLLG